MSDCSPEKKVKEKGRVVFDEKEGRHKILLNARFLSARKMVDSDRRLHAENQRKWGLGKDE